MFDKKGDSSKGHGVNLDPDPDAEHNAVTSHLLSSGVNHAPAIDIDIPAYLIPSSTEGHSHLYFDVEVPWDKYANLLRALADAGIVERGYADASEANGFSVLRLPWVKK